MEQDSPWKEIIRDLFPAFLQYFFPLIYADVNFDKTPIFLDKELAKIIKQSKTGARVVDKLVKVWLKNGNEQWLLIHIEVQGSSKKGIAHRVFVYNYRLYDKYEKEVVSLILLSDSSPTFREDTYQINRWGYECHYRFPTIKLLDYADKWDELETSTNPFSKVVQAFLKTLETQKNRQNRYWWKRRFLLNLYEVGFNKTEVLALYRFIDWIMDLPSEMDERILDEISSLEENKKMPYLSTAERRGIKHNLYENINEVLSLRFGEEGETLFPKVTTITDMSVLQNIFRNMVTLPTVLAANDFLDQLLEDLK